MPLLNPINLAEIASGDGSISSPFTGWESAISGAGVAGAGTISVSNSVSSTTVTGSGTAFTTAAKVGQWICVSSSSGISAGKISAITNNTSLTVESWNGPTVSGSAYSIYSPKAFYAPAGYYSFSSAINLAWPFLTFSGDGNTTIFIHTGSGKAITAIGNYTTVVPGTFGVSLHDFVVQGNANTTDCLWVENISHSEIRNIYVHNATNSGITIKDAVGIRADNIFYTVNREASSPIPTYGWYLESVYACTLTSCWSEGATGGVYAVSGGYNSWTGGAIEGNSSYGFRSEHLWDTNFMAGVDFESNPSTGSGVDIKLEGSPRNTFIAINSNGKLWLTQDASSADASWNTFTGGAYNTIQLDAGCAFNSFTGLSYNNSSSGSFTVDAAAFRNSYVNVSNRVSGALLYGGLAIEGSIAARRDGFSGILPSVTASTGFGTGASFSVDTASSNSSMTITATAGSSASNEGTITVDFSSATIGGVAPGVVPVLVSGSSAWNKGATVQVTAQSSSQFTVAWKNADTSLTNGQTYKFNFVMIGH